MERAADENRTRVLAREADASTRPTHEKYQLNITLLPSLPRLLEGLGAIWARSTADFVTDRNDRRRNGELGERFGEDLIPISGGVLIARPRPGKRDLRDASALPW